MNHLTAYFSHAESVFRAAKPLGVQASVTLENHALSLQRGDVTHVWRPKFLTALDSGFCYTDAPGPRLKGFAGWSPYGIRRWPAASDKIAFKRLAIEKGVRTPMACFDPALIQGPFLVKKGNSSFGEGMRGPFLAYSPHDPEQQLADGEYYENFLVGQIAKAWCWGDACFALHVEPPVVAVGDGQRTLRELVLALAHKFTRIEWDLVGRLAEYCGVDSLEAVPHQGKEVLVEYRYGTRYHEAPSYNANLLPHLGLDSPLAQHFSEAAVALAPPAPAPGDACFYTLDAIIDGDGLPWFLEMNCNPIVHPDLYAPMMQASFQSATRTLPMDTPLPTEFDRLIEAGLAASQASQRDEALALFAQASQCQPESGIPHFLIGSEHASAGDFAAAELAFASSVVLSPGFALARYQLGLLQFSSQRAPLALLTWQPLFALAESEALLHFVRGFAALAQDAFAEALDHFRTGLQCEPANAALRSDILQVIVAIEALPQAGRDGGSQVDSHVLVSAYARGLH